MSDNPTGGDDDNARSMMENLYWWGIPSLFRAEIADDPSGHDIVLAGGRPVSIGGDHSITGAILRAISGKAANLTNGGKVALLHLDAHTDTFEGLDHFLGARDSAAHSLQIGLRGNDRRIGGI